MNTNEKIKDVIAHFKAQAAYHADSAKTETDSDIINAHQGHTKVYAAMTALIETFEEFEFGGFGGSDAIDIKRCRKQMNELSDALSSY